MDSAETSNDGTKQNVVAAGGVLGALLTSTCCIGPLVLVTLGISGAWISNLAALAPYQPVFSAATLGFLGVGFWLVYIKPRKACAEGSYCANPTSNRIVKTALWVATVLIIASLTLDFWAPLFY